MLIPASSVQSHITSQLSQYQEYHTWSGFGHLASPAHQVTHHTWFRNQQHGMLLWLSGYRRPCGKGIVKKLEPSRWTGTWGRWLQDKLVMVTPLWKEQGKSVIWCDGSRLTNCIAYVKPYTASKHTKMTAIHWIRERRRYMLWGKAPTDSPAILLGF